MPADRQHQYGGFPCPKCGAMAHMRRSHIHLPSTSRWRRHRCTCGHYFSTVQVIATAPKGLWNHFTKPENHKRAALQVQV